MTAIGFAMMMAGFLIVSGTENPDIEDVGSRIFAIGMVTTVIGVALWLWRVMP